MNWIKRRDNFQDFGYKKNSITIFHFFINYCHWLGVIEFNSFQHSSFSVSMNPSWWLVRFLWMLAQMTGEGRGGWITNFKPFIQCASTIHCTQCTKYHAMTFAVNFTFVLNTFMLSKCQACCLFHIQCKPEKNVDIRSSGVHREDYNWGTNINFRFFFGF